ncbi:hypothetical protein [Micromonospora mirobrigensis]|uniref:LPXTG-motif cell wall anchor domain-containing protein n=1 Tax=Micromonospora mirobrigensis TaxID=262898 RepID=A0A1C4UJ11_9ACTN|nr:hypothetical protein [Micromonospora mirobrigensis]SCE71649.1 hypothetical protein GA0070564_101510 [Micromonospora mirobrigensis]
MSVRRHAARLATVCALLGGLVAVGASPALAEDDSVRVRSADTFKAGGSPGGVSVEVRKRSDGCVLLRTVLGLRLDGLSADQVQVQVNFGGRWWPAPVGDGGRGVQTGPTTPSNPTLCKGKSVTVKYRVAFLAGAPDGSLTVVGEATNAFGKVLDRGADRARVVGGQAAAATPSATPSATPEPTPTPTPTPSAVATVEPAAPSQPPSAVAAALDSRSAQPAAQEEGSGVSPIMLVGLALVLLGAGLIILLVRRSRADRAAVEEPPAAEPSEWPGAPLPRGGAPTTYRAGGPAPTPTGQVYGQPSAPSGSVYGAPAPRPAGGVYGGGTGATPTPPAAPAPHSGQGGPGTPPPDAASGGDATTVMPRLPG